MKKVGFWKEKREPSRYEAPVLNLLDKLLSNTFGEFPWPGDMVDHSWDLHEKETVARYLDFPGFAGVGYMGWSDCRLCEKHNGTKDFSDGVYEWPEGFPHYLREHSVKPPQEFINHVLARLQEASR